ncbi:hypothetical protein JYG30_13370 [Fibrella sp. USSR17]
MRSVVVPAEAITISQISSADSSGNAGNAVTIFLLERDIPPVTKRLGIVYIPINPRSLSVDKKVKRELLKKCQELGANGAYRLVEGYYPTNSFYVPYLLLKSE